MVLNLSAIRASRAGAALALSLIISGSADSQGWNAQGSMEQREQSAGVEKPRQGATTPPTLPVRFDLVCDINQRILNDPSPRRGWVMPFPPIEDFDEQVRYLIDLEAMRYCSAATCADFGIRMVSSWNDERIVLEDDSRGDVWEFFVVDRGEDTVESRVTGGDGFMRRLTGTCRREPFSGFPPGARRGF